MSEAEANRFFLNGLRDQYAECQACPLSEHRTQVVFGSGYCGAELLIVGEAPGATEDQYGKPFIGESGYILRRACARCKLDISKAFITNAVICRPPKNRKPDRREQLACRDRLEQTFKILKPRVILLVGATAGHWLGLREIGPNRGLVPKTKWPKGDGAQRLRAVILTYHPAWIMRQGTRESKKAALNKLARDLRICAKALIRARELDHEVESRAARPQVARSLEGAAPGAEDAYRKPGP